MKDYRRDPSPKPSPKPAKNQNVIGPIAPEKAHKYPTRSEYSYKPQPYNKPPATPSSASAQRKQEQQKPLTSFLDTIREMQTQRQAQRAPLPVGIEHDDTPSAPAHLTGTPELPSKRELNSSSDLHAEALQELNARLAARADEARAAAFKPVERTKIGKTYRERWEQENEYIAAEADRQRALGYQEYQVVNDWLQPRLEERYYSKQLLAQEVLKKRDARHDAIVDRVLAAADKGNFDPYERLMAKGDKFKPDFERDWGSSPEELLQQQLEMGKRVNNLSDHKAITEYMNVVIEGTSNIEKYVYDKLTTSYQDRMRYLKKEINKSKEYWEENADKLPEKFRKPTDWRKQLGLSDKTIKALETGYRSKELAFNDKVGRTTVGTLGPLLLSEPNEVQSQQIEAERKRIKQTLFEGKGPYYFPDADGLLEIAALSGEVNPNDADDVILWRERFENPFHPDTRAMYARLAINMGLVSDDPESDEYKKMLDLVTEPARAFQSKQDTINKIARASAEKDSLKSLAKKYFKGDMPKPAPTVGTPVLGGAVVTPEVGGDLLEVTIDILERPLNGLAKFTDSILAANTDGGPNPDGVLENIVEFVKIANPLATYSKILTGENILDSTDEVFTEPSTLPKALGAAADGAILRPIMGITETSEDRMLWGHVIANAAERNPAETYHDSSTYQFLAGGAMDLVFDPINAVGLGIVDNAVKAPVRSYSGLSDDTVTFLNDLGLKDTIADPKILDATIKDIMTGTYDDTLSGAAEQALLGQRLSDVAREVDDTIGRRIGEQLLREEDVLSPMQVKALNDHRASIKSQLDYIAGHSTQNAKKHIASGHAESLMNDVPKAVAPATVQRVMTRARNLRYVNTRSMVRTGTKGNKQAGIYRMKRDGQVKPRSLMQIVKDTVGNPTARSSGGYIHDNLKALSFGTETSHGNFIGDFLAARDRYNEYLARAVDAEKAGKVDEAAELRAKADALTEKVFAKPVDPDNDYMSVEDIFKEIHRDNGDFAFDDTYTVWDAAEALIKGPSLAAQQDNLVGAMYAQRSNAFDNYKKPEFQRGNGTDAATEQRIQNNEMAIQRATEVIEYNQAAGILKYIEGQLKAKRGEITYRNPLRVQGIKYAIKQLDLRLTRMAKSRTEAPSGEVIVPVKGKDSAELDKFIESVGDRVSSGRLSLDDEEAMRKAYVKYAAQGTTLASKSLDNIGRELDVVTKRIESLNKELDKLGDVSPTDPNFAKASEEFNVKDAEVTELLAKKKELSRKELSLKLEWESFSSKVNSGEKKDLIPFEVFVAKVESAADAANRNKNLAPESRFEEDVRRFEVDVDDEGNVNWDHIESPEVSVLFNTEREKLVEVRRQLNNLISKEEINHNLGVPKKWTLDDIEQFTGTSMPAYPVGRFEGKGLRSLENYIVLDEGSKWTPARVVYRGPKDDPLTPSEMEFLENIVQAINDLQPRLYNRKAGFSRQSKYRKAALAEIEGNEKAARVMPNPEGNYPWKDAFPNGISRQEFIDGIINKGEGPEGLRKILANPGSPFKTDWVGVSTRLPFLSHSQQEMLLTARSFKEVNDLAKDWRLGVRQKKVLFDQWASDQYDYLMGHLSDARAVDVTYTRSESNPNILRHGTQDLDNTVQGALRRIYDNSLINQKRPKSAPKKADDFGVVTTKHTPKELQALANTSFYEARRAVLDGIYNNSTIPKSSRNVKLKDEFTYNQLAAEVRATEDAQFKAIRQQRAEVKQDLRDLKKGTVRTDFSEKKALLEAELKELDVWEKKLRESVKNYRQEARDAYWAARTRIAEEIILQIAASSPRMDGRMLQMRLAGAKVDLPFTKGWFNRMDDIAEFPVVGRFAQSYIKNFRPPSKDFGSTHELATALARYNNQTPEVIRQNLKLISDKMGNIPPETRRRMLMAYRNNRGWDDPEDGYEGVQYVMNHLENIFNRKSPAHQMRDINDPNAVSFLTMSEINRYLPQDYMFDMRYLRENGSEITIDSLIKAINHRRNTKGIASSDYSGLDDPIRLAQIMLLATEQAMGARALKGSLVDTFGVVRNGRPVVQADGNIAFMVNKHNPRGEAIEGLKKLGWRTIEGLSHRAYFDPDVAVGIQKILDIIDDPMGKEAQGLTNLLDKVNHIWKTGQTVYNPGWYTRNIIGEVMASWFAGVNDPRYYLKAERISKWRKGTGTEFQALSKHFSVLKEMDLGPAPVPGSEALITLKGGRKITVSEAYDAAVDTGIISGFVNTDVHTSNAASLANIGDQGKPIMDGLRGIHNRVQDFGERIENDLRMAHFLHAMENSGYGSIEKAAKHAAKEVRKYHFDFRDYTKFEQVHAVRYFPFYKWSRKAIPFYLGLFFMKPGKVMAYPKAMNAISGAVTGQDIHEDRNGFMPNFTGIVPTWVQDLWAYQVSDIEGEEGYNNYFRLAAPQMDVATGMGGAIPGLETAHGLFNPMLKMGANYGLDKLGFDRTLADVMGVNNLGFQQGAFTTTGYHEARDIGPGRQAFNQLATLVPLLNTANKVEGIKNETIYGNEPNNPKSIVPPLVTGAGLGLYQAYTDGQSGDTVNETDAPVGMQQLPDLPMFSGHPSAPGTAPTIKRDAVELQRLIRVLKERE